MELWIRSQNKNILEICKALFIVQSSEDQWKICNNISFTHYGTYKTEERALEVLDEIQDKLKVIMTNEAGAEYVLARHLVPIIYEMPKE